MRNWLRVAFRRDVAGRALRVALIVGPILTLINQGDVLLNGEITASVIAKIVLTFLVPYFVSTYASVAAITDQGDGRI